MADGQAIPHASGSHAGGMHGQQPSFRYMGSPQHNMSLGQESLSHLPHGGWRPTSHASPQQYDGGRRVHYGATAYNGYPPVVQGHLVPEALDAPTSVDDGDAQASSCYSLRQDEADARSAAARVPDRDAMAQNTGSSQLPAGYPYQVFVDANGQVVYASGPYVFSNRHQYVQHYAGGPGAQIPGANAAVACDEANAVCDDERGLIHESRGCRRTDALRTAGGFNSDHGHSGSCSSSLSSTSSRRRIVAGDAVGRAPREHDVDSLTDSDGASWDDGKAPSPGSPRDDRRCADTAFCNTCRYFLKLMLILVLCILGLGCYTQGGNAVRVLSYRSPGFRAACASVGLPLSGPGSELRTNGGATWRRAQGDGGRP